MTGRMRRGFTMVEILMSMGILFMLLPIIYFMMGKTWAFYNKTRILNEMRQSSRALFAGVEKDFRLCGAFKVSADNHSVAFPGKGGEIRYILENGAVLRRAAGITRRMTAEPVTDAVFLPYEDALVVSIELEYSNINARRAERMRFLHSIPAEGGRR
jgi:hypothetical protein